MCPEPCFPSASPDRSGHFAHVDYDKVFAQLNPSYFCLTKDICKLAFVFKQGLLKPQSFHNQTFTFLGHNKILLVNDQDVQHVQVSSGHFILQGNFVLEAKPFDTTFANLMDRKYENHSSHFCAGERTCQMTAVTGTLLSVVCRVISGAVDPQDTFLMKHNITHYFGNGTRIGEAKNPGPKQKDKEYFRLALINPTALHHRQQDLLQLNADTIALSETSATAKVQYETIQTLRKYNHTCLFSAPVDNQKQRLDGDLSLRGQAAGTAIISRIPMRNYRQSDEITATLRTRLQYAFVQMGATTILLCVVYGFQQNQQQSRNNTDSLMQEAANVITNHPGPSILLGDVNHDLETLDSWKIFQDAGFRSSKDIYRHLYSSPMPPIYMESTTRDLGIFSPELAPFIQQITIDKTSVFPGHHPVLFDLLLEPGGITKTIWKVPKDWTTLGVNKAILEDTYTNMEELNIIGDFEQDVKSWSIKVESAVDQTLQIQHAIDSRQTFSRLPQAFKGRCLPIQCKKQRFRAFAPKARHGDFEPEDEVRCVQSTQILRQVRRLESIRRRVKKLQNIDDIWEKTTTELHTEWQAITKAKGFGHSFAQWVCQELGWHFFPRYVPSIETIIFLENVVKDLFNEKLSEDKKNSQHCKTYSRFLDHTMGYDRETYKSIKEPPKQFIKGLQIKQSWTVELFRVLNDNSVQVEVTSPHDLNTDEVVTCLNKESVVKDIQHQKIVLFFHEPPEDWPSVFQIDRQKYGMEPKDIHLALRNYWEPIWNKDQQQFENNEVLTAFQQKVDALNIPKVCDNFRLDNVEDWKHTIRKLNRHSAPGPDGWHNTELKMLPDQAIAELVKIFSHPSFRGYPEGMMTARVVSLPKIDDPIQASQTRPITILPSLFRLWTATFSRLVLRAADHTMPPEITGFIKGRGGTDSMYSLARDIEEAHRSKSGLSGLTLDLTKAFNQFPRSKTSVLMKAMGIPPAIVDNWFASLGNIRRYFDHRGWVSSGIASNTGVAEGDSASIIAMIAISTYWVMSLRFTGASMKAYADNLSWASPSFTAHRECVNHTIAVFEELGIPIDWNKTWAWCTKNKDKIQWQQLVEDLLPPNTILQIQDAATDLGVVQNYSPFKRLVSTQDRLERAVVRLQKIYRQNLPVSLAAKIIQTAVWPQALYAVEVGALGQDHFRCLRQKAAQAIVHHTQVGIAALANHLAHPILVDPECYAITQAIRAARKFLSNAPASETEAFLHCSALSNGRSHAVRGPAAALKNYLLRVGWNIDKYGYLQTSTMIKFHILQTPWKTIKKTLEQDWLRDLIPMHTERKTLQGAPLPNRELTVGLISQCPDSEQRGIVREIANTFQLETQKQKWTNDADGNCPYCMQLDTKSHRHYQCQATSSVWEQYPDLRRELEELDDIHVNLPVVYQPPELDYLQYCFHLDNPPEIIPEVQTIIQQQLAAGVVPTFYSDGSCFNPQLPVASLASWGLILSLDVSEGDRNFALQHCHTIEDVKSHFLVVATDRCHGQQSIDRAELQAILYVHERYRQSIVVTDSQYALDSWTKVRETTHTSSLDFLANSDLLKRLHQANQQDGHTVRKVQSHTWEIGSREPCPNYDTLGNEMVDQVAKSANSSLHPALYHEWNAFQHQLKHDLERRKKHYEMLGQLHKCQTRLSDQREQLVRGQQQFMGHLGRSVYEVFAAYTPRFFFCKEVSWGTDTDLDFPWTSEVSSAIIQFWNDIQWSCETDDELGLQGISWTELTLSFLLDRNLAIPTKIPHTNHWAMSLVDVKSGGWGFYHVSKCFFYMTRSINKAVHGKLFSDLQRGQVRSMQKLGGTNVVNGFRFRPRFPQQERVIQVLQKYFKSHGRVGGIQDWPMVGNSSHEDEVFWRCLQTAES